MSDPAQTLGFLLFDGFPMACLTSAIEPLRAANEIIGRREFGWKRIGESGTPVRSSADVRFDPDVTLAQVQGLDSLFLLAAPGSPFLDPRGTAARLRWLERRGLTLGAFSGGLFPLCRAGLMQGHRASVHWCYDAAFAAEFPDIAASDTVITRDRRRLTAAGAGAVFDLMLWLIEDRLGPAVMTEVACWFQHPTIRDDAVPQKTPVPRTDSTTDMLPAAVRPRSRDRLCVKQPDGAALSAGIRPGPGAGPAPQLQFPAYRRRAARFGLSVRQSRSGPGRSSPSPRATALTCAACPRLVAKVANVSAGFSRIVTAPIRSWRGVAPKSA